jgi:hypothetical protein
MPVCSWNGLDSTVLTTGVFCDPIFVRIRLNGNNLRGQIPTELGLLTSLEYITLCKFATVSS